MIHLHQVFMAFSNPSAALVNPGFWAIAATILISVVILLVGVTLTALLMNRLHRSLQQRLAVERWLQIDNLGNTVSVFHLRPDTGGVKVTPRLLFEGRPLANAVTTLPAEPAAAVQPAQAAVTPQPSASPAVSDAGHQPSPTDHAHAESAARAGINPSEAAGAAKKAKKGAMQGINTGRKIGGILGTLGSLLPGELGRSFKDQSTQIQAVTQKASKAVNEPEQKKQQLEHLQHEIKDLGGNKRETKTSAAAQAVPPPAEIPLRAASPAVTAETRPAAAGTAQAIQRTEARQPQAQPRTVTSRDTFQTPALEPGDTLRIRLTVNPMNIYRAVSVPFCLQSKQMAQSEAGTFEEVNSAETWQEIQIPGLPVTKSITAILLGILITAVNAFWVILAVRWISDILLQASTV